MCQCIMGLPRFYKTTVFTFIFAVFLLNVKDKSYRSKPVPAARKKYRHIGIILLPF